MAGRSRGTSEASVRPVVRGLAADEEEVAEEMAEDEDPERVGLEAEDEVIRKLVDPKLPTKEEVERHHLMGHLPYRNWCPVCVRAKGKERDHKQDGGGGRVVPERGIIVFQETKWVTNGLCW